MTLLIQQCKSNVMFHRCGVSSNFYQVSILPNDCGSSRCWEHFTRELRWNWTVFLVYFAGMLILSIHCPPHTLVLASKAAQKEIPDFILSVHDTLFYFRGSPARKDQFQSLLGLTDPDHAYTALVQYHKIRWLSLSDCVNRLCTHLPNLVIFLTKKWGIQKTDQLYEEKLKIYMAGLRILSLHSIFSPFLTY